MIRDFALPDLGEGLTESEIVAWRVAVGDRVELNQIIADIETAKAVVELPSPFAGVITALHAAEGETIDVGAPLFSCDTGDGSNAVPDGPVEVSAAEVPSTGSAERCSGCRTGSESRRLRCPRRGRPEATHPPWRARRRARPADAG